MLSISRLFSGYPGSANVPNGVLSEYADELVRYPPEFLDRVTDRIRDGAIAMERNTEFAPSIETLQRVVKATPMTDAEARAYRRINGLPEPLPPPERQEQPYRPPTDAEKERSKQTYERFCKLMAEAKLQEMPTEFDWSRVHQRFDERS